MMHQQMKYGRFDLDAKIQSSKEFRNPSIYEKLLSHVGIDEKGTNYPPVSSLVIGYYFCYYGYRNTRNTFCILLLALLSHRLHQ